MTSRKGPTSIEGIPQRKLTEPPGSAVLCTKGENDLKPKEDLHEEEKEKSGRGQAVRNLKKHKLMGRKGDYMVPRT